jgi:hypothetical protein
LDFLLYLSPTQDEAMLETTRNLASALEKMENRTFLMEQKNKALKKYKTMVKSCLTMQCTKCKKYIGNTLFEAHMSICGTNTAESPMSITITRTDVVQGDEDKPHIV